MSVEMHTDELAQLLRDAPLPFIAARIRRARKTASATGGPITHDELSDRTADENGEGGIYRPNLIGLEQGKHRPRLKTLLRIAEATGRDPRWFVDPEVDPSPFPDDGQRDAA